MNQTTLVEAYSRLKALKGNLPDRQTVSERYIVEFHSILDQLMKISQVNLNNFRVLSSSEGSKSAKIKSLKQDAQD